ncbi:hypothetical protein PR202_ga12568 [Eleusine coracana subsp. coracana]|uniref:Uncharacterized protein n=1 Tax=Eleusine coracana subsp. coracana TaxID=191504 RepID=A0AAV5CC97_ELECO|nr:hypothetical protein QOZ80_3AG0227390 [Eleusine coracana subsp. coracana]GJM95790.1 hypothetical protein PR202_ga12568 [Eleusine coracana subsp. coracana]
MGSCVSKKAARAGTGRDANRAAAPLPAVKEVNNALSPVAEEEEEVKEVVLSETPAPRLLPESSVKKRLQELPSSEEGSEAGSESASVGLVATEKEKAMAKLGGVEQEVAKRAARRAASPTRAVDSPEESKPTRPRKQGGRARSPSPRRQQHSAGAVHQQHPSAPRARREQQPAVVSAFGCRSGRFSPSAARRAAEVRRTHSARDGDMAASAKRSLATSMSRRDPGERSGRRSESPTASKRPSPAPSPVHHRQASRRAGAREGLSVGTPERARPRVRDVGPDGDNQPAFHGGEQNKKPEQGALGQNPSVAMECFIFL